MPAAGKRSFPASDPVLAVAVLGLALVLGSGVFLLASAWRDPGRDAGLGDLVSDLKGSVLAAESDLYHYLATARKDDLASHRRSVETSEKLMDRLVRADASLRFGDSLLATSVEGLRGTFQAWLAGYAHPASEAKTRKESSRLGGLTRRGIGPARFKLVRQALETVENHVAQTHALVQARESRKRKAAAGAGIAGALALLAGAAAQFRRQRREAAGARERNLRLEKLADYAEKIHHADSAGRTARQLAQALAAPETDTLVLIGTGERTGLAVAARASGLGEARELLPLLEDRELCPVLRTGQPLQVADAAREPVCNCPLKLPDSCGHFCFPLLVRGRTAGVAGLRFPSSSPPAAARLEEVRTLARITSLGVSAFAALEDARRQAVTDKLTGTFNRRFLESFLEKQVQSAARQEQPLAVLMLDLDRFKSFNDRFGHRAGDELLKACAQAMHECVREGDLAARFGGEEFTVVLPDADLATALTIGERIRSRVEELPAPTGTQSAEPKPTVSIGLAVSPRHGTTGADLIGAADAALYRAKEAGRNRVVAADS